MYKLLNFKIMFIILITNRFDVYDRYWVRRNTFAEAQAVANQYRKDDKFLVEIHELGKEVEL